LRSCLKAKQHKQQGCLKATAEKLGQEQINRGGSAVNITARESWDSERLQPKKGPGDLRGKKKKATRIPIDSSKP
jgi:hypothetical protein